MRHICGAVLLGLLVAVASALLASNPADALRAVGHPPSRPLDGTERYEQLLDESDLLLIARVRFVDSVAASFPLELSSGDSGLRELKRRKRRVLLEPVEWLRGGLDGDDVEAYAIEDVTPPESVLLAWIAQTDTLAGLIQLHRSGSDWFVGDYLRVLSQRGFRAVRDSILHARERVDLDSLVARADLIIVAADSLVIKNGPGVERRTVRVTRRLNGEEPAAAIQIQPYLGLDCVARAVHFLRRIGPALYEPLPFHSATPPEFNDWDSEWERQPFATETAVRRALERVSAARAGKPEQR